MKRTWKDFAEGLVTDFEQQAKDVRMLFDHYANEGAANSASLERTTTTSGVDKPTAGGAPAGTSVSGGGVSETDPRASEATDVSGSGRSGSSTVQVRPGVGDDTAAGAENPAHKVGPDVLCVCGHRAFDHVYGPCDATRGGVRVDNCERFQMRPLKTLPLTEEQAQELRDMFDDETACGAVSPRRGYSCDQPKGHVGRHSAGSWWWYEPEEDDERVMPNAQQQRRTANETLGHDMTSGDREGQSIADPRASVRDSGGPEEASQTDRALASPDDAGDGAYDNFESDLAKATSKTYWAEESTCMEETFGTVQRVIRELQLQLDMAPDSARADTSIEGDGVHIWVDNNVYHLQARYKHKSRRLAEILAMVWQEYEGEDFKWQEAVAGLIAALAQLRVDEASAQKASAPCNSAEPQMKP